MHKYCVLLLLFQLLLGCSSVKTVVTHATPVDLFGDVAHFGVKPQIPAKYDLFNLTPLQEKQFFAYYNDPKYSKTSPHIRIYDFLINTTYDFNYQATTHTASQTMGQKQGNCLSLAILTTALANKAHINVEHQLVDSTPVFEKKNDIIMRGMHIRSLLYSPNNSSRARIVDYFPGANNRFVGNVSKPVFVSMYYNNIAVDFLNVGDHKTAYWYARTALEYAPSYAFNLNTMAIIQRAAGDINTAENIYQYGLDISKDKLVLLKNYRLLLQQENRYTEAQKMTDQLDKIFDSSPYGLLEQADKALAKGELNKAKKYYKNAIRKASYLPSGYLGLAKTLFAQGKFKKAKAKLILAQEKDYNINNNAMYEAKMDTLTQSINQ